MIEYFGKDVEVIIDRQLGCRHPRHEKHIYPINYGYIPNTVSGDGMEIDAYILGEFEPLETYKGKVIAIVHRKDDVEDKLVIAQNMNSYTKEQIEALIEFQERFFDSEVILFDVLKENIRVTAKGIVRNDDRILVIEEEKGRYYRLLGGGVEFQEEISHALKREFEEEFSTNILEYKFLNTIENIFNFKGIEAHEICFLYDIVLPREFYRDKEYDVTSEILSAKAKWVDKQDFLTKEKLLLPEKILEYL